MNKISKVIILVFVVSFLACFGILTKAGSGDNVSGYAWSENIGWISFNNTSGGGSIGYGVDIDSATGVLSGYAWSENIGWIDFNETDLSGCPASPCQAKLDTATKEFSGWARAYRAIEPGGQTLGGWNGWIKLQGLTSGASSQEYGAWLDISGSPYQFRGWSWGGNETNGDADKKAVIGWVSFSCLNQGTCGTVDYKIVASLNVLPTVSDLQDHAYASVYCGNNPSHHFQWTFSDPEDGSNQTAYELQIGTSSDISSSLVFDSGHTTSSAQERYVEVRPSPGSDQLAYNTTYHWQVKAYDSSGNDSGWVKASSSFITEDHHYPSTDFTWSPEKIHVGEPINFQDQSTCYGFACSSWLWTIPDANYLDGTSASSSPTVQFVSLGSKSIELQVSDGTYTCSLTHPISVKIPLPKWKEVAPF